MIAKICQREFWKQTSPSQTDSVLNAKFVNGIKNDYCMARMRAFKRLL
jgi:hypothetical protein